MEIFLGTPTLMERAYSQKNKLTSVMQLGQNPTKGPGLRSVQMQPGLLRLCVDLGVRTRWKAIHGHH